MKRYFHNFREEKTSLQLRQLSTVYSQMLGTLLLVFVNILF